MQKAVMKHTRAIVNNQAFLTGDTHETIIDRCHLPRVLKDLGDDLRHAREAQDRLPDWMYSDTWQAHLETQLALPAHRAENESGTTDAYTWACPYCECMFPSSTALKHHARRVHDHVDRCIPIFNKAALLTQWGDCQHVDSARRNSHDGRPWPGTLLATAVHLLTPTVRHLLKHNKITTTNLHLARVREKQWTILCHSAVFRKFNKLRNVVSTLSFFSNMLPAVYSSTVLYADNGLHHTDA